MDKATYSQLEQYMLSCMEDTAHDAEHIYRVLYNALTIAGREMNVNYDVLIAACLLHDIGRKEQFADPNLCHAAVGSEKAHRFLTVQGFSPAFADHVRDCIRTHRFRKSDQPQSIEAKILFDADKLDVTGAIGIARSLMYKGEVTEPLYSLTPDGQISDGTADSAPSFCHEYKFKLEKLYDKFLTDTGRAMAAQRRQAAVDFYNSLLWEAGAARQTGKAALEVILSADAGYLPPILPKSPAKRGMN